MASYKIVCDPIHGHIEIHPVCVAIIDTPQFQRLRNVKQLGGCYFVYPGASHNRFEHSIGVCHLAGELGRALRGRQPELQITDIDILCLEIAGLCHDLGHGPFSHLFDQMFIPAIDPLSTWKHEEASRVMFDYLVEDNLLLEVFDNYNLQPNDVMFIKEQISGPIPDSEGAVEYRGRRGKKSFLYEVVANKRNEIDVDKWDYFARDCHGLGIKSSFDHLRCIQFARIIQVQGQGQLCFRDKEASNLYDMFYTRLTLHKRAYMHPVNKIIEEMLVEALVKANDHLLFKGTDGRLLKMSEAIHDMVAYMKMTDYVVQQILLNDPDLTESQEIIEKITRGKLKLKESPEIIENNKNRKIDLTKSQDIIQNILKRKLYKCIAQSQPSKAKRAKAEIQNELCVVLKDLTVDGRPDKVNKDEFLIMVLDVNYGMKDKNPIDNVMFYTKTNPDKAVPITKDQVSILLPESFSEQTIRVYTKNNDQNVVKALKIAFAAWCDKNDEIPKAQMENDDAEMAV